MVLEQALAVFGLWPTKPRFLKEAVPKIEVLEQPQVFVVTRYQAFPAHTPEKIPPAI
jgi:hypothetical protein